MEFLTTSKINFQSLKLNAISFDGSFDSRVYFSILKNSFKETERSHHRLDSLKNFLRTQCECICYGSIYQQKKKGI